MTKAKAKPKRQTPVTPRPRKATPAAEILIQPAHTAEAIDHPALDAKVSALLTASRAAHEQAKALRRSHRVAEARDALSTAARLRREAHALDPDHIGPAWVEEQRQTPRGRDTHAELIAWYVEMGV
jgi:hypothetical protein